MKIYLLLIIFTGLIFISASEKKLPFNQLKKVPTEKMSNTVTEHVEDYVITRKKLNDTVKYAWFIKGYNDYKPNEAKVKLLRKHRKHLNFVVFGGSWCDDTHMWLPKFYKTVETAKIRKRDVKLFGVDRNKKPMGDLKTKTLPEKDYKVDRVPTFIVYYDGKEAGRIIESVRNTIEEDILEIIEKVEKTNKSQ